MTSIRGNILKFILRVTNNLNPIKTPHAINKIRKYSAGFINDKTPKGFSLSKETTLNGAKFERLSKEGAKRTGRVIYYLHGGAYISGLIYFYRNFVDDFDKVSSGAELILLDYSLAPEHKFPTQLNEAVELWDDLISRQGYNPNDIILGGDSAGGNLALALLLKLRDDKKLMPRAAFCISPWADMTASGNSYIENYPKDILFGEKNKEITEDAREQLLNSEIYCFVGDADRKNPYVSPVFGEYHNFPPMYFSAGGHEILLSDTLTIVDKLKQNKIFVECDIKEEMFHTFPIYGAFMPEAEEAFEKILNFIKAQFLN